MRKATRVAFIGNPNCGKTTLFNAYTGANLKVANWPGVTVEKKEGSFKFNKKTYKLVDLPGTYSLTSYSMEEIVAREYILNGDVNVIIDVVDASSLERNLYLALQLIELGRPVVIAMNMMDIVKQRGIGIDFNKLSELLGVPVIPISARKREGLNFLMNTVSIHKDEKHLKIVYSEEIEDKIKTISSMLWQKYGSRINNLRWYAIKYLERDVEVLKKYPIDTGDILTRNYEEDIINEKYNFIEKIIGECLKNRVKRDQITDKADKLLTNKIWGLPILLCIMALVFFLTFTVGNHLKESLANWLEMFSNCSRIILPAIGMSERWTSLIIDGIITGVGGILTFLPNIFILFLALAFLEDSGYMARVAYVMDGIMEKIGLPGKAFIPMILGFGCTVPAIMASRTLSSQKDRLKTILLTPFMSCSAKIPIYVLFSGMFFPKNSSVVAFLIYIIGLGIAIIIALIMGKFEGSSKDVLLIELPDYKRPSFRTVTIYVWDKVGDYLEKAGTTIFIASIILWILLNFGLNGITVDHSESFGTMVGQVLVPVFKPAGLGYWQIIVALIAGLAAKEVVVSSMGVLYGVDDIGVQDGARNLMIELSANGFGVVNALSLMVFCLLYVPCIASIATIYKETKSIRWTIFSVIMQLTIAWIMAILVYQLGKLI